eukprot:691108-Amphidinium_carterae.1
MTLIRYMLGSCVHTIPHSLEWVAGHENYILPLRAWVWGCLKHVHQDGRFGENAAQSAAAASLAKLPASLHLSREVGA